MSNIWLHGSKQSMYHKNVFSLLRCNLDDVHSIYYCNLKVGGSFHIAPGKSFTISHVHVHDVQPFSSSVFNTTHIIKHLSFGTDIEGANTAPLNGIIGLATEGIYILSLSICFSQSPSSSKQFLQHQIM